MENLEDLKRRIRTATDLHSLVRTMKALAAVNIRQLENAVESLADYKWTIELGMQIVLRSRSRVRISARRAPDNRLGLVVFGSDQGMCGQLNDLVARYVLDQSDINQRNGSDLQCIAVGARVVGRLEDQGFQFPTLMPVPSSTAGIIPLVQDLLVQIDHWRQEASIDKLIVIHAEHTSRASYEIRRLNLLPIDRRWFAAARNKQWPTNQSPTFTMEPNHLFSALVNQYLFVSLYRASAESLASENASRLAAMRGAERNIGGRIETLTREFHQTRQMSITEELLDIASGFEAIENTSS